MHRKRAAAGPILLAASPGGHLELLERLRPAIGDREVAWATAEGRRAEAVAARGEAVATLPLYGRSPARLARNAARASALLARLRPALVVTSGAGLVVPLGLLARLDGVGVVFAETMARVAAPSLSGRALARVASSVLVQWPELADAHPAARLCRPALLDDVGEAGSPGRGTFVAVGTHSEPFDRLLAAVDRAVAEGRLPPPVLAQSGPSRYRPRTYSTTPWMAPEEVEAAAASARHVVCHAGSGMVAAALRAGRRPLVMPRLRRHREHVDDHQRQLAGRLVELELAVAVDGEIREGDVRACEVPPRPPERLREAPAMGAVLREEVDRLLERGPLPGGRGRLRARRQPEGAP